MNVPQQIGGALLLFGNRGPGTPTNSVLPSLAPNPPVIGTPMVYGPGDWSTGTPEFDHYEVSANGVDWTSAAATMPDHDSPPTDSEFGKFIAVVETNGGVEARSAATGAVDTAYGAYIRDTINPIFWRRYRETSGTAVANSGSAGATLDGTLAGTIELAQTGLGPQGTGEGLMFDGTTTKDTTANNAALSGLTTQRWAFFCNPRSLGESNQSALFEFGVWTLRFSNTTALVAIIETSGTDSSALTNAGQVDFISQPCWIFMDFDDANALGNGRRIRLFRGLNGALAQLTLQTNVAATGTVTPPSADFVIGNNSAQSRSFDGVIDEVIGSDGLWTTEQMEAIVAATETTAEPLRVFFGDSITAGSNATLPSTRWVNIVAADQGWEHWRRAGLASTVLQNSTQNSVATIGAAANNNARDNYTTRVLTGSPSVVLILYGLNDLRLNDAGFSAANFETDLGEVVDGLTAGGVLADDIVIGSPPHMVSYGLYSPYNGGNATKHDAYRDACAAVALAKGTRFADVYQAMLDNGGDALVDTDGVHPKDTGHAVIAAAFIAALDA